jgi:hypothetical protein
MRWFRSRVQLGTRAALFALAVQLMLSFGHLHVKSAQAGPVLASRVLGLMIQPRTEQVVPPAAPTQHHPATLVDEFCAVCAAMQLVGVGAESPALALPDAISRMKLAARAEFASAAVRHSFFDARAPPNA